MKHSIAPIPTGTDERPLRFWDFIRAAAVVSVCVTVALPVLFVPGAIIYVDKGNPEVLYIAPFLWFLGVLAIWVGTLSVGCLVMIPVGIGSLSKRLARKGAGKTIPEEMLWDRWIDGPEPLRPLITDRRQTLRATTRLGTAP